MGLSSHPLSVSLDGSNKVRNLSYRRRSEYIHLLNSYAVMSGFGFASNSAAGLSSTLGRSVSLARSYTFSGTCAALSARKLITALRFGCVRYSCAASRFATPTP